MIKSERLRCSRKDENQRVASMKSVERKWLKGEAIERVTAARLKDGGLPLYDVGSTYLKVGLV
jgi:hypothetical protein